MIKSPLGQTIEPRIFSLNFKILASLKKIEQYFNLLELKVFSC